MSNSTLTVITSDGKEFHIKNDVVKQAKLLKFYFDGRESLIFLQLFDRFCVLEDFDEPVRLPHIQATILQAVSRVFSWKGTYFRS